MSSRTYGSNPISAAAMVLEMSQRSGALIISDTTAYTGRFSEITALAAAVVNTVVSENPGLVQNAAAQTSTSATAFPIPVGTTIYGSFTSIQLTSGTVIAYKAP